MNALKIFDKAPSNWKELQEFTSIILTECGMETEIEKTIETVRGNVEVDVYGKKSDGFELKVICECKYWESTIPQTIIHAFRTVIHDSGVSQGYIISKAGFQKGAYNAATTSNISILTWEEFLEKFKLEWFREVIERNYKIGREMIKLSHDIINELHNKRLVFSDNELNDFYEKKESNFYFYTFREHYLLLDNYEIAYSEIDNSIKNFEERQSVKVSSYHHFFHLIEDECKKIIAHWKTILTTLTTN